MEYKTEKEDSCGIQERGIALLARAIPRPLVPDLCPELFKISAGDSVQVSGTNGCSMLLYHLLSHTLLPARWCGVDVGGCGAEALFIDTDQRFSVLQLAAIMEATLKKKILSAQKQSSTQLSKNSFQHSKQIPPTNPHNHDSPLDECNIPSKNSDLNNSTGAKQHTDDPKFANFQFLSKKEGELKIKTLISDCLRNFVFLKCQFSVQFFTTLLSIDQVLAAHPLVALIFIDSFPGFYWSDRIYSTDSWPVINKHYSTVMSSFLAHLRKSGVALIYVKSELLSQNKTTLQKSSDNKSGSHTCLHCGEMSTTCNFFGRNLSPSVLINISIPKLNNDISDGRKRRHTYSVHVSTDKSASCLQATIHQYGLKWLV